MRDSDSIGDPVLCPCRRPNADKQRNRRETGPLDAVGCRIDRSQEARTEIPVCIFGLAKGNPEEAMLAGARLRPRS